MIPTPMIQCHAFAVKLDAPDGFAVYLLNTSKTGKDIILTGIPEGEYTLIRSTGSGEKAGRVGQFTIRSHRQRLMLPPKSFSTFVAGR
jgi:hypothetical protein